MKLVSTYAERIMQHSSAFQASVDIYRAAVTFFIGVTDTEWAAVSAKTYLNGRQGVVEALTVATKKRPVVPYPFEKADRRFYKMPCYLRRAAINEAIGKVSSYRSSLAGWEGADPKTRGRRPGLPKAGYVYPVLYRDNMYQCGIDQYTAKIKVFIRHTWDWARLTRSRNS